MRRQGSTTQQVIPSMPRIRLTKSAIDALPTFNSDVVYWDAGYPGFGVKVTPKGRKVFIVFLPHGWCRIEAPEIHHRAIRACDSSSG
jgi:hypothetical protein